MQETVIENPHLNIREIAAELAVNQFKNSIMEIGVGDSRPVFSPKLNRIRVARDIASP